MAGPFSSIKWRNSMIVYFNYAGTVFEKGTVFDLIKDYEKWKIFWDNSELSTVMNHDDLSGLGLDHYKCILYAQKADHLEAKVVRFADLHRHSDNSLKDGMIKIPDMVRATEYYGALTDHGNMYGYLEFYKAMKAAHKHPVIGLEAYAEDMGGGFRGNHLILFAQNTEGYHNLIKIASDSYQTVKRYPHVTWSLLEKYHKGIIATSACLGGVIPQLSMKKADMAEEALKRYLAIFGRDNFYLEIQRHGLPEEEVVNPYLLRLAKKYQVKVIATTDAHYLKKEDAFAHEVLLCLQTRKMFQEPHLKFHGTGYHIHTSEEMETLFHDMPEALDNTLDLAMRCQVEIELNQISLPQYKIPKEFASPDEYFAYQCKEGFLSRFQNSKHMMDERYRKRYEYEMEIIRKMGFASYFLIVWDYINYARTHDIYVGPGRGSAAGSLLAYCLGITDLDPIKYNLLFERFLNPDRVSMPDIDVDFEHARRQEVIDYIAHKYGQESVCHIVTFGTMAAKSALKDVSRVLGYPASYGAKLSKLVPDGPKTTILKALHENPALKDIYDRDDKTRRVIEIAMALEGCKRHSSQHACGLIVSSSMVSDYFPTSMELNPETKEKSVTSQVVMTEAEELGLLKVDILGLKNMSVIHEVIERIKKTRGIVMDYHDIPLNDRETYQMLQKGGTGGVFQLESPGMTKLIAQILNDLPDMPDEDLDQCFDRLIAAVALYRPGPMDFIPDYIAGMRNQAHIHYDIPELKPILASTYGTIVYQEEVMQIVQQLAGFSMARADVVRKAMGKKKQAVMDAEREVFIYGNKEMYRKGEDKVFVPGCVKNGITEAAAIKIWDKMAKFAEYAFNKSHAACYAYIAAITAYMSCHFSEEFYAAMLNAFIDNTDKLKAYLAQADKRGIKIYAPDINLSEALFSAESGAIRFGLRGIKGLNKAATQIISERKERGQYQSFQSLYERLGDYSGKLDKQALEGLIYSGALHELVPNKMAALKLMDMIAIRYKNEEKNRKIGQISMFTESELAIPIPICDDISEWTAMEKENEYLGFYLTKHPVDSLYGRIRGKSEYTFISDLLSTENKLFHIQTIGLITQLKKGYTKNRDEIYRFQLEDKFSSIPCVLFPRDISGNRDNLIERSVVEIHGNCQVDPEFGIQIVVQQVIGESVLRAQLESCVYIQIHSQEEQEKALEFIKSNPGDTSVALCANNKVYRIKYAIGLSPKTIDYLQSQFEVSITKFDK